MKEEYLKELGMSYLDLCKYLQQKYGMATCDYYATPECRSKSSKVTRTAEGLFCHHIFEDRYSNLGHPRIAKIYPFEAQKKENLAYCNFIEHLLLHLKINANSKSVFEEPFEIYYFFDSLGFIWIAEEINSLFKNGGSSQNWRNNCFEQIKEDFEDYISILKAVLCFIDQGFMGEKSRELREGYKFPIEIVRGEENLDYKEPRGRQYNHKRLNTRVIKIDKNEDRIFLKMQDRAFEFMEFMMIKVSIPGFVGISHRDRSVIAFKCSEFIKYYDYNSIMNNKKDEMALAGEEGVWENLRERLDNPFTDEDIRNAMLLREGLG